jgi:hypothetical protein
MGAYGSTLVTGKQSAPTAGTAVAATGTLAHGDYQVTVSATPTGTVVAATDINNIQLQVGATVVGGLTLIANANSPATSPPVVVNVPSGGATVSVNAVANASGSVVYNATLVVTPLALYP